MIDHPSPNWDSRGAQAIDILLLHYTGMESGEAALARLCDPAVEVSAHYLIEEHDFPPRRLEARAWVTEISRGETGTRSVDARLITPSK